MNDCRAEQAGLKELRAEARLTPAAGPTKKRLLESAGEPISSSVRAVLEILTSSSNTGPGPKATAAGASLIGVSGAPSSVVAKSSSRPLT